MRLRLGAAALQLRAFLRTGTSDSSDSERGALALAQGWATPVISPSTSLRFSVEFQRFLMALSVLHQRQASVRASFPGLMTHREGLGRSCCRLQHMPNYTWFRTTHSAQARRCRCCWPTEGCPL